METSASSEARSAPSPYPTDPLGLESCAATARDTAKRRQRIGGVGDRASKRCNPDADVFVMRLAAGLLGGHLMTDGRRVKQADTGRQNDGDRGCYTNKAFQAILERLKKQHRVEQRGSMDLSCITDYEFAARERG